MYTARTEAGEALAADGLGAGVRGVLVRVNKVAHIAVVADVVEAAAFTTDLQRAGRRALDRVEELVPILRARGSRTGGRRRAPRRLHRRLGGRVGKSNRKESTIEMIPCNTVLIYIENVAAVYIF
ncbi:hypothetical protein ON010_g17813 [Phytophthora cinnamomi]|nr:hypothetical protein ON010_g17813 [Phytophthora cinnamomi]